MSSPKKPVVVDIAVITFLVDNCIEWFTKLPPGFTHELPQRIRMLQPNEKFGVPCLDFDQFCCGAHGFSALIQTQVSGEEPHYTLFDAGPDSSSLVRNIAAMGVPVDKIERVITSHWHSDHTGGLLSFLNYRRKNAPTSIPIVVDVHPDRPIARGIAPGPRHDKVVCALSPDPTFELMEAAGALVEPHDEGHATAGGTVWVSGEIPRVTQFEVPGALGGMRWTEDTDSNGRWVSEEEVMDERYAAIDVAGKGLIIFSACSHAGIVNVIMDAVNKFGRPIYMIIGGLHLAPPDYADRIEPTVQFLSEQLRPSPTYILPMHCSGFNAKTRLQAAFGEGCVPAGVGLRVQVEGNREDDKLLFPPVF